MASTVPKVTASPIKLVERGFAPQHAGLKADSSGAGYTGPGAQQLRAAGPGTLAQRVARLMSGDFTLDASTRGGFVDETSAESGGLPVIEREAMRRAKAQPNMQVR